MNFSIILVLGAAISISFCTQGCTTILSCQTSCSVKHVPADPYFCLVADKKNPCSCMKDQASVTNELEAHPGKAFCGKVFAYNQQTISDVEKCGEDCEKSSNYACDSREGKCVCKKNVSEAMYLINENNYCAALPLKNPIQKCKTGCKDKQYFCAFKDGDKPCECPKDFNALQREVAYGAYKQYGCGSTELVSDGVTVKDAGDCSLKCFFKDNLRHSCVTSELGCDCPKNEAEFNVGLKTGGYCEILTCQPICRTANADWFCLTWAPDKCACGATVSDATNLVKSGGGYSCEQSAYSHQAVSSSLKKQCGSDQKHLNMAFYCAKDPEFCKGYTDDEFDEDVLKTMGGDGYVCGQVTPY